MFNSLSLRYALPLWIILLAVFFTIVEVFYTFNSREDLMQSNFQTMLQSDGNRLSAQIEQILRMPNNTIVKKQDIKRLFSLYLTGSTSRLTLRDKNGKEIVSSGLDQASDNHMTSEIDKTIKKVSHSGSNIVLVNKNDRIINGLFSVRMPPKAGELRHDGYGTIDIEVSYSSALEKEYSNAYKSIILRLFAVSVLAAAIIFFIRKRVIVPVARMVDTIKIIAKGEETPRMDVEVQDELGKIAISFNEMVESLNRQKHELEEYKNNLENRVAQEISKRHEQEGIMLQQSRLAGMGELIGNIAHQWRQPLNVLGLMIVNIEDAYNYGELTKERLEKAVQEASEVIQKMSKTIDDFRSFFEPDKDKISFNLLDAVNDSLSLVKSIFTQEHIEVTVEIDPSLELFAYKNEFSQIMINLFENARDAIIERKITNGKIGIIALSSKEEITVSVKDNGGGIEDKILQRIFEPYFSTKEEGKGSGIGLYMSKTIIEEHHQGKLTVRNNESGAIFTATFPVV
ncbi:MAG: HAMP domain-containing sensor histidine kinase [Sulfuricurvum sp.]|nr:HAMP domain-containing sensor histidine kinase [Sulfuricurvum sp.]